MSNQAESTPQPPKRPEYDPAFRQTFLWRASHPEDAEKLIRFGDLLFTLFNEGHFRAAGGWPVARGPGG